MSDEIEVADPLDPDPGRTTVADLMAALRESMDRMREAWRKLN